MSLRRSRRNVKTSDDEDDEAMPVRRSSRNPKSRNNKDSSSSSNSSSDNDGSSSNNESDNDGNDEDDGMDVDEESGGGNVSNESADPFAMSEEDDEENEEEIHINSRHRTSQFSIPRSTIEEGDQIRLMSLSRHLSSLKSFVTDKVYGKLQAVGNNYKASASSSSKRRLLDDDTIEVIHPQPKTVVNCVMRQYQLEGLNWLIRQYEQRINCVLGDEMGLGKTLQSISFFAHLLHVKKESGPFLIVVPLTVMFNWINEFKKFCPTMRVLRMHSNDMEEQTRLIAKMRDLSNIDAVITTYECVKQGGMAFALKRQVWRAVFLDEGHRIRNDETLVSKAAMSLGSVFKVVLSGTPLQNNLGEAGTILKFLAPNVFTDLTLFETAFNLTEKVIDRDLLNQAHYMMRIFMLRRIKAEVEQKLPPKLETKIDCPMTETQKELTQFLLFRERSTLERIERMQSGNNSEKHVTKAADRSALLGLLAHLRKAANHPYLFEGIEDVEDPLGRANQDIIDVSGKMQVLDTLLRKLQEKGHRVVLFSQFVRTLDIICDYLEYRGYKYQRLDGSTNRVMREVRISLYNKKDSEFFIFCLSTRAGGEGVNLFTADTVILFDSDWNPQVDIQAMARVHRIGQTKTVHIYRLVTMNSVEEMIVHRAQKKLFLDSMVNRGSTAQGRALDVEQEEAQQAAEEARKAKKKTAKRMITDGSDDENEDYSGNSDEGRPSKRTRKSSTDNSDTEENRTDDNENTNNMFSDSDDNDEDETGAPKASKIFALLKFGWQSIFSPKESTASSGVSDEDIDALIDRTRGLANTSAATGTASSNSNSIVRSSDKNVGNNDVSEAENPNKKKRKRSSAATDSDGDDEDEEVEEKKQDSSVEPTGFAKLAENQEQNVLKFDEHEPLVSIGSLRVQYFSDFESKLKNAAINEDDKVVATIADDNTDNKTNKRKRESRTQTVHVAGLGEIQILKQNEMVSLAQYGHRQDVSSNASSSRFIMKEFLTHLREKKQREQLRNNSSAANKDNSDSATNKTSTGIDTILKPKKAGGQQFSIMEAKGRQVAGRDFQHEDFCQICWDGGLLVLCDRCPCCYHKECLELVEEAQEKKNRPKKQSMLKQFSCPHHYCYTCARTSSAAGLLFRCEHCDRAYCEDCVPTNAEVIGECARFHDLGYRCPSNACYIRCSVECQKHNVDDILNPKSPEKEASESNGDSDSDSDISDNSSSEGEEEEESVIDLSNDDYDTHHRRRSKRHEKVHSLKEKEAKRKAKEAARREKEEKQNARNKEAARMQREKEKIEKKQAALTQGNPLLKPIGGGNHVKTIMKSRFDLDMALGNCSLPDIRLRLQRDETFPGARFLYITEIPNFWTRYHAAGGVARTSLNNLLFFISEQNKKVPLPTDSSNSSSIVKNSHNGDDAADGSDIVSSFCGVHPAHSTHYKTEVFFATLQLLSSMTRHSLPHIAQILGICTPSFIKRYATKPSPKFMPYIAEPKFTFNIGNSISRSIMEESIASFLVILSPLNMIIPNSKEKNLLPALTVQYRAPSQNANTVSANNKSSDNANDVNNSGEDSEEEMESISVTKRYDGFLLVTRLLQCLGECAMDENRQYFTAIALFEFGLPGLQMYRVEYPGGVRPEPAAKLVWIWPMIRLFRRILTKEALTTIYTYPSRIPPSYQQQQAQTSTTRALVNMVKYRPEYRAYMDIDSGNLVAYLIQGVQIMFAIQVHNHRLATATISDANSTNNASFAVASAANASTPATMHTWQTEQTAVIEDETSFLPTAQEVSEAASALFQRLKAPNAIEKNYSNNSFVPSSHYNYNSSNTAKPLTNNSNNHVNTTSNNNNNNATAANATGTIMAVTFKLLSCRVEFTSWFNKSKNPLANLTSVCHVPITTNATPLLNSTQMELMYFLLWMIRDFDLLARVQLDLPTLCHSVEFPLEIAQFMQEKVNTEYHPRTTSSHKKFLNNNASNNISSTDGNAHLVWRQHVPAEHRSAVLLQLYHLIQEVNKTVATQRQRLVRQKVAELSAPKSSKAVNTTTNSTTVSNAAPILDVPPLEEVRCRLQVYELALLCFAKSAEDYALLVTDSASSNSEKANENSANIGTTCNVSEVLIGRVETFSYAFAMFLRSQYRQRQGAQALVVAAPLASTAVTAVNTSTNINSGTSISNVSATQIAAGTTNSTTGIAATSSRYHSIGAFSSTTTNGATLVSTVTAPGMSDTTMGNNSTSATSAIAQNTGSSHYHSIAPVAANPQFYMTNNAYARLPPPPPASVAAAAAAIANKNNDTFVIGSHDQRNGGVSTNHVSATFSGSKEAVEIAAMTSKHNVSTWLPLSTPTAAPAIVNQNTACVHVRTVEQGNHIHGHNSSAVTANDINAATLPRSKEAVEHAAMLHQQSQARQHQVQQQLLEHNQSNNSNSSTTARVNSVGTTPSAGSNTSGMTLAQQDRLRRLQKHVSQKFLSTLQRSSSSKK